MSAPSVAGLFRSRIGHLCNLNRPRDDCECCRCSRTFTRLARPRFPARPPILISSMRYGSYICYNCTVMSNKGPPITVRKRYSEFVDLREELVKRYPRLKSSIPKLPPKKVVEQRRRDLEYFFKYIVLHPTLGASPIVIDWIAP
ncbi:Phox homologous domain-containing protein [Dichotomocladium elegans]|nr:Phox homologous domain-containing protein [Dichotomocladium elegans]